jgi:hypothetical protein
VINGSLSNWQGSGTNYSATFIPTAGATNAAVVVSSDRFTDAAGNPNKDGGETNNAVSFNMPLPIPVDNTPPTVIVTTSKSNLAVGETSTVNFMLSESSTDFVPGDVTVINGSLSNWQGSGTNYSATFIPTAGATNAAVVVSSERFTDAAGNTNKDGADTNNAVSFSVGTPIFSMSQGPSLDLSRLINDGHSGGTGSSDMVPMDKVNDASTNVFSLSLGDVLGMPIAQGMHSLMLMGEANDKLVLTETQWSDAGNAIKQDFQSYAAQTGYQDSSTQLLIDQQMLQFHQGS